MRTLVIAGDYPWPADSGPRLRLAMTLRGLRRCGPVELVSVVSRFRTDFDDPDRSVGLARVARIGFDNRPPTGAAMMATVGRPSMPLGMPWRDRAQVQRSLARFLSGTYDLVWIFGARPWILSGGSVQAPVVLDLDDLEDQKIAARIADHQHTDRHADLSDWTGGVRRLGSSLIAHEEMRRWRRLHRAAGERTENIVVCSTLDAERARAQGLAKVSVVPNGYRSPAEPVGRSVVGSPPCVLFQGQLKYPPNIEAATLLARQVGPALRAAVADVQIRLVGDNHQDLLALDDPPRVRVVGRVPDMATELARADVVAVPIFYGSGTRVKILEAFAHRVPVVSTTRGAEGLGAIDGTHLLIGDTVQALADACARLLSDRALREVVTTQAYQLYSERFRSDVIEEEIARLALEIAGRFDTG